MAKYKRCVEKHTKNEYFCRLNRSNSAEIMSVKQIPNRLKAALADNHKTSKWLAVQLGKSDMTVSRWCTNRSQPSVHQLIEIANLLDVDVSELLNKTK